MRTEVKVEELSGGPFTADKIQDEINSQLSKGWAYHSSITVANKIYLIFTKRLAQ